MTPRARVLAAINHEVPDRVPIDLGGFQTGIHKRAYAALLSYLRDRENLASLEEKITTLDPIQQLAVPCEGVLERFRVDTRYVTAHGPVGFTGEITQEVRGGRLWHDFQDEFGVVWSMPDDQQLFMDISHHPLAHAERRELDAYPFPEGGDPTRFTGVRDRALDLRNNTPYALCTGIGGVVYEVCWYLRGLERWFTDILVNPGFCEALLDRTLGFWLDFYTGFLEEVGDLVDVVMIGDDLGGQGGPLFAPDFYRKFVKPRQKRLIGHIKSLTTAKVWYHTCGSCVEFIPDFIVMGINILNPVQVGAEGMDPKTLKERFGRDIVFWGGGIDPQHVLPFASPAEVRETVRTNLEAFKPGGGYVFNNVHNIQYGVPPENIVALFDAAHDFGRYD